MEHEFEMYLSEMLDESYDDEIYIEDDGYDEDFIDDLDDLYCEE